MNEGNIIKKQAQDLKAQAIESMETAKDHLTVAQLLEAARDLAREMNQDEYTLILVDTVNAFINRYIGIADLHNQLAEMRLADAAQAENFLQTL